MIAYTYALDTLNAGLLLLVEYFYYCGITMFTLVKTLNTLSLHIHHSETVKRTHSTVGTRRKTYLSAWSFDMYICSCIFIFDQTGVLYLFML